MVAMEVVIWLLRKEVLCKWLLCQQLLWFLLNRCLGFYVVNCCCVNGCYDNGCYWNMLWLLEAC